MLKTVYLKTMNKKEDIEKGIEELDTLMKDLKTHKEYISLSNEVNNLKARILQLEILISNMGLNRQYTGYATGSGGSAGGSIGQITYSTIKTI